MIRKLMDKLQTRSDESVSGRCLRHSDEPSRVQVQVQPVSDAWSLRCGLIGE